MADKRLVQITGTDEHDGETIAMHPDQIAWVRGTENHFIIHLAGGSTITCTSVPGLRRFLAVWDASLRGELAP